jgi:hypothetical protein
MERADGGRVDTYQISLLKSFSGMVVITIDVCEILKPNVAGLHKICEFWRGFITQ